MLAEVLLVLSGHPSSFFVSGPEGTSSPTTLRVSPALEKYLHPGEISTLNSLAHLAFQYSEIKRWAQTTVSDTRRAVMVDQHHGVKGKERAKEVGCVYTSNLASGVLDVLGEYESLIVELETKVLHLDPGIVQDNNGYVPLSVLVAAVSSWTAPLASLYDLMSVVETTQPSPGRLIDLLSERLDTGHPELGRIYTTLRGRVERMFVSHLTVFVLFGHAPSTFSTLRPALGLDIGPDASSPRYRMYALNEEMLPRAVGHATRESLLYVGRVAATLRREGRELPRSMIDVLRCAFEGLVTESSSEELAEDAAGEEGERRLSPRGVTDLDRVVQLARREVGEWLWRHILTGSQIVDALETFGNYFLTRRADYAVSLIQELTKLHSTKIILSDPSSSSSVIRDTDLHLAWLRSSLGTSAEHDRSLDTLHLRLDHGPLRALPSTTSRPPANGQTNHDGMGKTLFSSFLLGTPMTLHSNVTWPLDLFITPQARSTYSEIQAYLLALRTTQQRVLGVWLAITSSRRPGKLEAPWADMQRDVWALTKLILFFFEELLGHFMTDIIDVQHKTLLAQLDPPSGDDGAIRRSGSVAASLRGSTRLYKSQSRDLAGAGQAQTPDAKTATRPDSPASTYAPETVRSRVPPTPNRHTAHLDFLTLRQMHSRHLAFLRQGLLLADRELSVVIRDILDDCTRFAGLIERWGGDVLPRRPIDQSGDMADDAAARLSAIKELKAELHEHLSEFFRALVQSQNPSVGETSTSGPSGSFSRTTRATQMIQSSRIMSRQVSFTGPKAPPKAGASRAEAEQSGKSQEAENLMGRHVEQLLLRLDFNGTFTSWIHNERDVLRDGVLAEGGL